MKTRKLFPILVLILFSVITLSAQNISSTPPFPDNHLILEAAGKVVVKADKAVFSFAVNGYGSSLRAAVADAKKQVAEIVRQMGDIGIAKDSFSTASFVSGENLYDPSFWSKKKDYNARLNTDVSLRDVSKLDEAILILSDNDNVKLGSLQFVLDDPAPHKQRARELALNRINEQKTLIESKLGVVVTGVQLIDEAPFQRLPWDNKLEYPMFREKNPYNAVEESLSMATDSMGGGGGFFSPDMTIEIEMRVIFKVEPAKGK